MGSGKTPTDPDAIWGDRSNESRDEARSGPVAISPREGVISGANMWRPIESNGDFAPQLC